MPTSIGKDATTPYLSATTGRMLRPPSLSATTKRMLQHPIYQLPLEGGYDPLLGLLPALAPPNHPYMIIWSLTSLLQWILQLNVQRHLFESLKHCLYTLKHISSSNSHLSSSWLFTNKNQFKITSVFIIFNHVLNLSVTAFSNDLSALVFLQQSFPQLTFRI